MKDTISKNLFLNAAACPTLGWRLRANEPEDEVAPTLAQQFRMEQGTDIGRTARRLFPEGVIITTGNLAEAVAETTQLVQAGGPLVLFEAAFVVDDYAARADILSRVADGWHLIEVKSNVNLKQELIDDLAYTVMVLSRAGIRVAQASMLLISKDFRLGMQDSKLFTEYDCTDSALARAAQFQSSWDIIRDCTSATSMPDPSLILACKTCQLFSHCLGNGIDNHIFEIPRLSLKKVIALKDLNVFRIEDIPPSFELTTIQARARDAVSTGEPWIGPDLRSSLNAIQWPACYLDFETVMTALPLYPDVAPYTQIPTQYSIHKCTSVGVVDSHSQYLSDLRRDSRRELAEQLIVDLQGKGSIISYSSFEKTTINGLATLFPDLEGYLGGLVQRLFDLEAVIRDNYYHPSFHGRTSAKSTVPALVPDMSYATLNIKEGDSASAAFARMAMGQHTDEETESVKNDLLEYCRQDTLAMVKLHERLDKARPARAWR
jgi:hypothetical protein